MAESLQERWCTLFLVQANDFARFEFFESYTFFLCGGTVYLCALVPLGPNIWTSQTAMTFQKWTEIFGSPTNNTDLFNILLHVCMHLIVHVYGDPYFPTLVLQQSSAQLTFSSCLGRGVAAHLIALDSEFQNGYCCFP